MADERVEETRPDVPRGHDAAALERLTAAQLDELDDLAAECMETLPRLPVDRQIAAMRAVLAEIDARIGAMLDS